jgi:hypothetical protein
MAISLRIVTFLDSATRPYPPLEGMILDVADGVAPPPEHHNPQVTLGPDNASNNPTTEQLAQYHFGIPCVSV